MGSITGGLTAATNNAALRIDGKICDPGLPAWWGRRCWEAPLIDRPEFIVCSRAHGAVASPNYGDARGATAGEWLAVRVCARPRDPRGLPSGMASPCVWRSVVPIDERERERRRRLAKAHVDAENAHDLDAIVATFAPHAVNDLNGAVSIGHEAARQGHALFGLSREPGLMSELTVVHEIEHFTDEEIVYEGHFRGIHTGSAPGFPPPSGLAVKLPYIVAYRFDDDGLLVSERARVDVSPLYASPPAGGPGAP